MPTSFLLSGPDTLSASRDPILRIVAARVKWRAPDSATALNAAMPLTYTDGTTEAWLGALVENKPRTITRSAAGNAAGYDVTSTLEGLENPDHEGAEDFELQGSTGEDKLETCETLDLVMTAYGGTIDSSTGRVKFPQTLEGDRNPAHGIDSFYNPGLVWTRKWTGKRLDPSLVARLGKIDAPPGNPPELEGNRNWLLYRITGQKRGNIWQYSASWLQSGPFGWLPEIYGYR